CSALRSLSTRKDSMLVDEIKAAMFKAMKAGNVIEKEVLRTALGEVTATGESADDARMIGVLRKLVKSNEETLAATSDPQARERLEKELEVLRGYLPKTWTPTQIEAALTPVAEAIRAATGDGPATGIAMKRLKSLDAVVEGKDVAAAVQSLRATR